MPTSILAAVVLLLSLPFLYISFKLLWSRGWFYIWLRASAGLASLFVVCYLLIGFVPLMGFESFSSGHKIAEVALKQDGDKEFVLTFSPGDSVLAEFRLFGDHWRIEAKVVRWRSFLAWFGLDSAYRLDRVSGRFNNLSERTEAIDNAYSLHHYADSMFDIWGGTAGNAWMPWVEARYGSGTYVPMIDNARYALYIQRDGLYAKPLNDIARQAVSSWN